jgi:hypothetical protein
MGLPNCTHSTQYGVSSASENRGTEAVAIEGPANRQVVDTATIGTSVVSIASLTALARDGNMKVDDDVVSQRLSLVVAEV